MNNSQENRVVHAIVAAAIALFIVFGWSVYTFVNVLYTATQPVPTKEIIELHTDTASVQEEEMSLQEEKKIMREMARKVEAQRKAEAAKKEAERIKAELAKRTSTYKVTAYDLSVASCGKPIASRGYGVTRSGYNLSGHTRESTMTVAVDPKVIPLGSKLKITFKNPEYQKYNGIYTARDTGGGVRGKHIDLFLGDFGSNKESKVVSNFGVTKAEVTIISTPKKK